MILLTHCRVLCWSIIEIFMRLDPRVLLLQTIYNIALAANHTATGVFTSQKLYMMDVLSHSLSLSPSSSPFPPSFLPTNLPYLSAINVRQYTDLRRGERLIRKTFQAINFCSIHLESRIILRIRLHVGLSFQRKELFSARSF